MVFKKGDSFVKGSCKFFRIGLKFGTMPGTFERNKLVFNTDPGQFRCHLDGLFVWYISVLVAMNEYHRGISRRNILYRTVRFKSFRLGVRVVAGYFFRPQALLTTVKIKPTSTFFLVTVNHFCYYLAPHTTVGLLLGDR